MSRASPMGTDLFICFSREGVYFLYFLKLMIRRYFLFDFSYVTSWTDAREVQSEKANLQILFDKYVPTCLDTLRVRFKKITPIADISMVQTLCYLLECLLTPQNTPPDCNKELYELYFVFAAVWAFGGSMFQDQVIFYLLPVSSFFLGFLS